MRLRPLLAAAGALPPLVIFDQRYAGMSRRERLHMGLRTVNALAAGEAVNVHAVLVLGDLRERRRRAEISCSGFLQCHPQVDRDMRTGGERESQSTHEMA